MKKLSRAMNLKAKNQEFEEAAKIRDQINSLSAIGQQAAGSRAKDQLQDLKKLLNLDKLPQRIEAFDISNISGKEATGAMVSFYQGLADKNNYRRFRIKSVKGINDYDMLKEVIRRRYLRVAMENLPIPDLILIDGGRSHLLVTDSEIKKLGLNIPLVSIAKDRENIYIKNKANPIKLNQDTAGLNLIRRLRDEAHRFAIAYHHLLRRKKIIGK